MDSQKAKRLRKRAGGLKRPGAGSVSNDKNRQQRHAEHKPNGQKGEHPNHMPGFNLCYVLR